jgi:hypothetical protein
MAGLTECFNQLPDDEKDYLEGKINDLSKKGLTDRGAQIRALQEAKDETLNDLQKIYTQLDIPGFDKESISSSKIKSNEKGKDKDKDQLGREEKTNHEGDRKGQADQKGDVNKKGSETAPLKRKVESAVIEIGGKIYEGKNHGEAIDKAAAAGEDVSKVNRERDGKFKLSDGEIIDRKQAKKEFGARHSEELIKQTDPKQKQINDVLDKVKKFNEMISYKGETGAEKRGLLNEIRKQVAEIPGYKVDYKNGHIAGIKGESGKYVQARSEETNRTEKSFDKSGYKPETTELVKKLSADPVMANGFEVKGADGRTMSDAQLKSALKDIREGKDTVGAKLVYDAVDKMHDEGMIRIRDQSEGIPIDKFNEAFKDPLKENIDELPISEISDEDFNKLFDDTINDVENGNIDTSAPGQTQQTDTGTAQDSGKESGRSPSDTQIDSKSEPQRAATALRESAQRLAAEGDRDGAIALYQAADRAEAGPNWTYGDGGGPGDGSTMEGQGQQGAPTGVKKGVIEEERNLAGKTKIENQLKRDFPEVVEGAKRLIAHDPDYPNKAQVFINSLRDKQILTAEETVALSLYKADLQNQAKRNARDLIEIQKRGGDQSEARFEEARIQVERDTVDRIATRTNYEKGLSLAVNKLLFQEDYSAATLINRAKSKTASGELTPEQTKKFQDMADELEKKQEELEKRDEEISKREAEQKLKDLQKEKEARDRKEPKENVFKEKKEKILKERKDLIEQFKKEIKGGEGPARQGFPLTDKMVGIVAKLAKNYVEDGIVTLQEVVNNIVNDLKEHAPGIDERDVRDAISGYGKPQKSTLDEVQSKLRDLQKQATLVSKIEDVLSGKKTTSKESKTQYQPSEDVVKLNQQLQKAMEAMGVDPYGEKALKSFKTRLRKQRDAYIKQISEGDFKKQIEKKVSLVKDKEALKLQAEVQGLKSKIEKEIKKIELAERPKWLKGVDFLTKWRRAILLSSVSTVGKLTAAATERSLITPMEELIGKAFTIIPGLRDIAKMAPREGSGYNLLAEKAAARVFIDKETLLEAKKRFKGEGTLDLLYGKREKILPDQAIDFFAHVHSALKTPAYLNEFYRAKSLRSLYAESRGLDTTDPIVEATIAAQATIDANRAIMMQDNWTSTGITMLTNWLTNMKNAEGKKMYGGEATADMVRMVLPILKVPTNFVWESTSYAAGILKAAPGILKAVRSGVESLSPNEADFVIRALKKQALGAAVLALGFYAGGQGIVGGYYTGKRKDTDIKAGDIELFGHKVPHWLLHSPLIEMLQFGATLRRVHDEYSAKGEDELQAYGQAGLAATKGLFGQIPYFNMAGSIDTELKNTKSLGGGTGEFIKSFLIPPTVQAAAVNTDTDAAGNPIERRPGSGDKGFLEAAKEHIETGIPGLRKNVPSAAEAGAESKAKAAATRERTEEEKRAAEEQ